MRLHPRQEPAAQLPPRAYLDHSGERSSVKNVRDPKHRRRGSNQQKKQGFRLWVRVRGFRPTFLPLSRSTRPPAARCCVDLGLRALLRCLCCFAALSALCWWVTLLTAFAALACLTHPQLSTRGCSWSPSTNWRLRVRWLLEITMRQVSALESTCKGHGRDARPGPESVASGRLFCLSLAPPTLSQRAAAQISVSMPCFVAWDALPHSPRYDGGRPSGPHSQLLWRAGRAAIRFRNPSWSADPWC
jgi:hypothetical protein